jgi:hypothetical protein
MTLYRRHGIKFRRLRNITRKQGAKFIPIGEGGVVVDDAIGAIVGVANVSYVGIFVVEPADIGGAGVFSGEDAEVEGEGMIPCEMFAAFFEAFQ